MRSVSRPDFDAGNTFLCCIKNIKDKDLVTRLNSVLASISTAASKYSMHAKNRQLHLVKKEQSVGGTITAKEMVQVYDSRMARKGTPGRRIYDALKLLPDHGICPFCDQGYVSTLDHVLPKSLYPALAVAPDNLVGACRDCNTAKSDLAPSSAEDAPFHPYFENVSGERWLSARVVEGRVAALVFEVTYVDAWPATLNLRILNHFRALGLGLAYASHAAREISGHRDDLKRVFRVRGKKGVKEELRYRTRSWEVHGINCWQSVAFRALSESEWYCEGGFRS